MLANCFGKPILRLTFILMIFYRVVDSSRVCPRNFSSLRIKGISFPPYVYKARGNVSKIFQGELVDYVVAATNKCCPQMKINYQNVDNYTSSSDDIERMIRSSDSQGRFIYFPVLANRNEKEQFNRYFLGLYESPGFAVIQTESEPYVETATDQIDALLATWPILLACVLTAFLSGVIIWILDCRQNKDFSTGFISGAGSGVWWSFVTMTTVGYGDKSPKSFFGRFFAIVWMIIGTVLLSILSGQITAYLTSLQVVQTFSIQGKQVAVPLGVQNFLEKELNLGATYEEYPIQTIMKAAITGDSSGIGGRKFAIIHHYEKMLRVFAIKKNKTANVKVKMMISHPTYLGMVCSHVPDPTLNAFFDCWQRSVLDQIALAQLKDRAKYRKQLNQEFSTPEPDTSTENISLISLAGAVGAFIVIGLIWELSRRCKRKRASVSD